MIESITTGNKRRVNWLIGVDKVPVVLVGRPGKVTAPTEEKTIRSRRTTMTFTRTLPKFMNYSLLLLFSGEVLFSLLTALNKSNSLMEDIAEVT
jgi:hypothetical protein